MTTDQHMSSKSVSMVIGITIILENNEAIETSVSSKLFTGH